MYDDLRYFFNNGGIFRGMIERKIQEKNNLVLRNEVSDYIIDSCFTFDAGYETAICKKNPWVIVERYKNEDEMKRGHTKWCEFCKKNPTEAYSVQSEKTEKL